MRYRQFLSLAPLVLLAACGGGGAATTTAPEPPAAPAFADLVLSPQIGSVEVGSTFQLTASPRDGTGNELLGAPGPSYTSSDASKATVSASGEVTGVAQGSVTITATLSWGDRKSVV